MGEFLFLLLLTVVSSGKSDKSSVVPDGTATLDKTIVEHDFCDLLAREAPLLPENVQLVALLTRAGSGAAVIKGPPPPCSSTGEAARNGEATTAMEEEEEAAKEAARR